MKRFLLESKTGKQVKDIYEWCEENIGSENVLWWDAKTDNLC
jgi:hypothetical protein